MQSRQRKFTFGCLLSHSCKGPAASRAGCGRHRRTNPGKTGMWPVASYAIAFMLGPCGEQTGIVRAQRAESQPLTVSRTSDNILQQSPSEGTLRAYLVKFLTPCCKSVVYRVCGTNVIQPMERFS